MGGNLAKWKLKEYSSQIADTGDYDGHCEITNGKATLLLYDCDYDEEAVQKVVDSLNESECNFVIDDSDAELLHYTKLENDRLIDSNRKLREAMEGLVPVINQPSLRPKNEEEWMKFRDSIFRTLNETKP